MPELRDIIASYLPLWWYRSLSFRERSFGGDIAL